MLSFAPDVDTRLEVDTMVVSPEGHLRIGTEDNPIQDHVTAEVVFSDNGNIDTNWDPMLLSRGMISHGTVEIYGAEKTPYLKVATAPMAGDTTIELQEMPDNWQVGDKLVLTGTHYDGLHWTSEDEEVYITAINGTTVTIDRPLQYNHDTPREDLFAYTANLTRNVTFSSEGGDDLPVHQRGHVMFMHSDDVDVFYAGFVDLGRTDKSVPAFDGEGATLSFDSNIKGRYSLHFHKTGTADQEDPAVAVGNVVDGNPGWGFVHHSSHAEFTDNIGYDVFGAVFAAEDGDETGIWLRNMAIKAEGIGQGDWTVKRAADVSRHDNGRTGDGFFFAGRLVEVAENIAANTNNGYVWMHRSAPSDPLSVNLDQSEIAYGGMYMNLDQAPIHGFRDNEAFGTSIGIVVIKANPIQGHDVRTVLDGFLAWETREGVNLSYTAHYTLLNFDLVGASDVPGSGVLLGNNTFDMVINGIQIEGFSIGINASHNGSTFSDGTEFQNIVIDATFTDVGQHFSERYSGQLQILSSDDLTPGRLSFDLQTNTVLSTFGALPLDGVKVDSIGATHRTISIDQQGFDQWGNDMRSHLSNEGYYTTENGQFILLLEDYVADRATGELLKMAHVITLNMTQAQLNQVGAKYNGVIVLGGPAPEASDDTATTSANQDVYIDVLQNDHDPDGGSIRVDGTTDPDHGDVFVQEDGTILYRPNRDYTGSDEFEYWVADEEGNYTKAKVHIEVSGDTTVADTSGATDTGTNSSNAEVPPADDTPPPDAGDEGPDGTPIIVVFGQSNAGLLYSSSALQNKLEELGSDAQVILVAAGGVSVANPDGAWNIVTGDGFDAPGYLYTQLLAQVENIRLTTPDAYMAGAIWVQGEADSYQIKEYYDPVVELFTSMREDLGESFPIIILGPSDFQNTDDAARAHVEASQIQVAEDLPDVYFLDADDVITENGLSQFEAMRDGLHYNSVFFTHVADEILTQPEYMLDLI